MLKASQKKGLNKKLIIGRNYADFQEQEQTETRKEQERVDLLLYFLRDAGWVFILKVDLIFKNKGV